MSDRCSECGAPVPVGGSCRDNLHALLFLEAEVPGGPGEMPHFFAVATYALQRPSSMGYTEDTIAGLRSAMADATSGAATIEEIRRRVRRGADAAGRVTRREGDREVTWGVDRWPMTVVDVVAEGVDGYSERVEEWARSVLRTLDALGEPRD